MKKKLLFVNGHLNVGGVERSLTDLLCHLDYSKYDVDLLLLEDKGDYISQIPKQINILFFDTTKAYGPLLSVLIRNLCALRWRTIAYRIILLIAGKLGKKVNQLLRAPLSLNEDYDVAIAYRIGFCAELVAYTIKAKRKFVWWHHGEIIASPSTIVNYNKTWSYFNYLVSVSKGCKEMLAHTFDYPVDRIVVLPNMVDITKIVEMAGKCSPYNSAEGKINIVSVGRLCIEKHFEDVVFVSRRLLNEYTSNFHWYIIGDGDLYNNLSIQITKQGVEDYVTLLGKKNNPYPWIKFADLFVHPSYVESQGLTILEAMALRTPCVVSRSIGPSGFMVDGESGVMTDNNADSLYKGVVKMLEIEEKRAIIQKALKTVTEEFSIQTIIKTFDELVCYEL
ncbi:glycosyltransferase [uncultured Bacteroides sp.]|jgi:glycosyltransferase involved in cell wall biosynthesis|uniref:glycosyltransferase n=1 Tax=uncultured Bacteroides sp. TaxID=162156 RepID=UPI002588859C|nr:glycosyltransferase [uncultured Bacteroides sp.]